MKNGEAVDKAPLDIVIHPGIFPPRLKPLMDTLGTIVTHTAVTEVDLFKHQFVALRRLVKGKKRDRLTYRGLRLREGKMIFGER